MAAPSYHPPPNNPFQPSPMGFQGQGSIMSPYAQPNMSGSAYGPGVGMSQQRLQGVNMNYDKAPVCCKCCDFCNCKHMICAGFWAIFNLIQLVLALINCVLAYTFPPDLSLLQNSPQSQPGTTTTESARSSNSEAPEVPAAVISVLNNPRCLYIFRLSGSDYNVTKFGLQLTMLLIYTVGSIIFAVAVFFKSMNQKIRIMFIHIYIGTCACFPLAYAITIFMDMGQCPELLLILVGVLLIVLLLTGTIAFFGIRIPMVFKKWILATSGNAAITPSPEVIPSVTDEQTTVSGSASGNPMERESQKN